MHLPRLVEYRVLGGTTGQVQGVKGDCDEVGGGRRGGGGERGGEGGGVVLPDVGPELSQDGFDLEGVRAAVNGSASSRSS